MKSRTRSKRKWGAYNTSATEPERLPQLLKSLCDTIEEPANAGAAAGTPIPRRQAIFAVVMMIYSGRRAESDLRACVERGYLHRMWSYRRLLRTLADPTTAEILTRFIEESAGALAGNENLAGQFALGSAFDNSWFDQKLHVMIGTATNVVTSAKVSPAADARLLPDLLAVTAKRFTVKEVSAGGSYLCGINLEAIDAMGAIPLIPFQERHALSGKSAVWQRALVHFALSNEDFERRFRRRYVDSAVAAIKTFASGGALRSTIPAAQVNELLAMVLLHNLTCLCHEMAKSRIERAVEAGWTAAKL